MPTSTEILVTGGAGYIGSHVIQKLLEQSLNPVIIDSLCNSTHSNIAALEKRYAKKLPFYHGDITDPSVLKHVFTHHNIDTVMHFAALKDVNESTRIPFHYYRTNVEGTIRLVEAMNAANVHRLVFSSSASVYGLPEANPVAETAPFKVATSPYGATKQAVEAILAGHCAAFPHWSCGSLRYFNPVGSNSEYGLYEDSRHAPTNLFPIIIQAIKSNTPLNVYGTDLPTADGSGVRDFIHIDDLAAGHTAALNHLDKHTGFNTWNLGTGKGHSVLEVIHAFERHTGLEVPYIAAPGRAGDAPECWAKIEKARKELDWTANQSLDSMVASAWAAQS